MSVTVVVLNHLCYVCQDVAKYMARGGEFLCTIHAEQAIKAGVAVCTRER